MVDGRVPPHALDAEAAVLSAMLLSGDSVRRVLAVPLRAEHFYSDANERIYGTIEAIDATGAPVDIVSVASYLRDREWLARVGGASYLAQLADATPAVGNVEAHAMIVVEKWRQRATIATCQRIAAEGYGDVGSVEDYIARAQAEIDSIARAATRSEPTRIGLSAMLDAPTPATRWICEGLQWCPGRPPVIIGYPGAGKTIAALSAAVSLMLDRPIFGYPDFRPAHACRVLHVDFDQGKAATHKRIRRLLAGMGVTAADIAAARAEVEQRRGTPCADLLEVETDPRLRLTSNKVTAQALAVFEAAWCRVVQGFDVVTVDSLRKLAPLLEENDSRFGEVPEALRRVSERTGVTIILIHHAGRQRSDTRRPITETGRGSSAIDGAAGSQLVIEVDGALRRVVLARESAEADRPPPEPFYLELVRVQDDAGRFVGHRLEHRPAEQSDPPESQRARSGASGLARKILDATRSKDLRSASAIYDTIKGNRSAVLATVKAMRADGRLVEVGGRLRPGERAAGGDGGPCKRCGGKGTLEEYAYNEDGRCFRCEGSGRERGGGSRDMPADDVAADDDARGTSTSTSTAAGISTSTVAPVGGGTGTAEERENGASEATKAIRVALASGPLVSLDALRHRIGRTVPGLKGAWDELRAAGVIVRVGSGRGAPWGLAPAVSAPAGEPSPPSTAPR